MPVNSEVQRILDWLRAHSTAHDQANFARFGITATDAFGVSMANIQKLAKLTRRSHTLAAGLWKTGKYEARLLTAFVDEPARVTPAQMDRWCRDFDNWGICDTLCFKLFDQTPHAWDKVRQWRDQPEEFVKRAAFALLASLALHDKQSSDEQFIHALLWIESAATDDRNFVKKGVSWALRGIGRRNPALRAAAKATAERLAVSKSPTERWIGRDALRDFAKSTAKRPLYRGNISE